MAPTGWSCLADIVPSIRNPEGYFRANVVGTFVTLQAARAYLDTLAADGHPKFILLATDGAPNCNDALDGSSCACTNPLGGCILNPGNCLDDARNKLADMLEPGRRPTRDQLKTQQEFIESHCTAPVR